MPGSLESGVVWCLRNYVLCQYIFDRCQIPFSFMTGIAYEKKDLVTLVTLFDVACDVLPVLDRYIGRYVET
jgi:hypothetical protein